MELKNFDQLVEQAQTLKTRSVVAVAAAADAHVIESVIEGKERGIADPILVGDAEKIKSIIRELGKNPSDFNIVNPAAGMNDAEAAVELIKDGSANFLMKGMIETTDLLRPVVKKENNLRTGRAMSHLSFNVFDAYHKVIVNTDGGMTPYPDLEKKKQIIINCSETLHKLGYELPKFACVACKETYDPKMPETMDGAALKEACEKGELGECFVEGPISYDIAMSREIAEMKKFNCEHVENFDVLLQPNIHAANIMGKCWTVSCHATMCGIVVGSRVPIVLTSRGSSAQEKFLSLAMAAVVSAGE